MALDYEKILQKQLGRNLPDTATIQYQRTHQLATFRTGTEHAAGFDLSACIDKPVMIEPGEAVPINSGIKVIIPDGWVGTVRSRSGLAFKHKIRSFIHGTIDADYRGEIQLLVENASYASFTINPGDRIAQLVVTPCLTDAKEVDHVDEDETERGQNGFGSTGV